MLNCRQRTKVPIPPVPRELKGAASVLVGLYMLQKKKVHKHRKNCKWKMVTSVNISSFQVIHKKEAFRAKHLKDQHPHLLKELKFTKFRLTVATSKVLS